MPSQTTVTGRSNASRLRGDVSQVVRRTAFAIQARARRAAPVDTGFLRNSIQVEHQDDLTSVVFVGAEYGPYVEFGTSRMAAQPYFTPAVVAEEPAFIEAVKAVVSNNERS